ncbi:MAG: hypothetical protein MUE46_00845 [Xanthomonadales bacterium]|jgi:hypothetical protein|nr:hypothetical protein [Xanthomonadales bacterium]
MLATLFQCLDFLRLSGSPADLSHSRRQMLTLLLLDLLAQSLMLAVLGLPQMVWIEGLLVRLLGVWLVLWLRGHPARYVQTLTGLFGVSMLLSCGLLAVSVLYLAAEKVPLLLQLLELIGVGLLGWLWLAGGRVLARGMGVSMPFGVLMIMALHSLPLALRVWLAG